MDPSSLFFHYITRWHPLGYLVIFIGVIFEGDVFLITTGFLARLRYFELLKVFAVVLVGTYTGDLLWYWSGRWIRGSTKKIPMTLIRLAEKIEIDFSKNLFRTLFITKFAYGTHHLMLVKAGMEDVPLGKYVRNIFLASFLWIIIVGGLGYIFAESYLAFHRYFKFAEIGVLAMLVVYFFVIKKITKTAAKKTSVPA
ncbi:MAG TPA: VTT domain-containing protein [Bacteroidota bacterium]|nr:VTT domain-containing protein [Bacteroidota bacterium]